MEGGIYECRSLFDRGNSHDESRMLWCAVFIRLGSGVL